MQLSEIFNDSLKLPWIAGTHIRAIKRYALTKFSICQAVLEIKENKVLALSQVSILILGLCKIFSKYNEFLLDDLSKVLSSSFETPQKQRLSNIDSINQEMMQSTLRYSGASLKVLSGSYKKNEDFRRGVALDDSILDDMNVVSIPGFNNFFGREAYLEPVFEYENMEIDQNIEFHTPVIDNKSFRSGFKSAVKSSIRKKKLVDDVTVMKRLKDPPLREIIERIRIKIEFPEIPDEILQCFRMNQGEIEEFEIKIDENEVKAVEENFEEFENFNIEVENLNLRYEGIVPSNLEALFEIENNPDLDPPSPIKNTQVVKFEERLAGFSKRDGKCMFGDVVFGCDRLSAGKAFSLLLVSAMSEGIQLKQEFNQDIEICWKMGSGKSQNPFSQFLLSEKVQRK